MSREAFAHIHTISQYMFGLCSRVHATSTLFRDNNYRGQKSLLGQQICGTKMLGGQTFWGQLFRERRKGTECVRYRKARTFFGVHDTCFIVKIATIVPIFNTENQSRFRRSSRLRQDFWASVATHCYYVQYMSLLLQGGLVWTSFNRKQDSGEFFAFYNFVFDTKRNRIIFILGMNINISKWYSAHIKITTKFISAYSSFIHLHILFTTQTS